MSDVYPYLSFVPKIIILTLIYADFNVLYLMIQQSEYPKET